MKKAISSILVTLLGLALLVYSGMRSLDFVSATLPPDKQILAYFALAATEGGIVFWLIYFLYAAQGGMQRGIALLMVLVDFLGSVALFTADTLLRSAESGMVAALSGDEIRSIILAMSGIIAMNVAATLACHIFDPDNQKVMAVEEGQAQIDTLTLKKINEIAPSLAAELGPQIANDWAERTRVKYLANLGRGLPTLPDPDIEGLQPERVSYPAKIHPSLELHRNGNGQKPAPSVYNAEASLLEEVAEDGKANF